MTTEQLDDEYKETSLDDLLARKDTMSTQELRDYIYYAWERITELEEENRLEEFDADWVVIIEEASFELGKRSITTEI